MADERHRRSALYTVTDPSDRRDAAVSWKAPALNTVLLRFTPEEVQHIITYGRPGTPMPAWGLAGGGPMNAQQVQNLLAYIKSIQIRARTATHGGRGPPNCPTGTCPGVPGTDREPPPRKRRRRQYGRSVRPCSTSTCSARATHCHTSGWSYGEPTGAGRRLRVEPHRWIRERRLPQREQRPDRLHRQRLGLRPAVRRRARSGSMPGFGDLLTDEQINDIVDYVRSLEVNSRRFILAISWDRRCAASSSSSRRRADGFDLPAARHQHRGPPRVPGRFGRSLRVDVILGGIWWVYGIGLKGPGRRGSQPAAPCSRRAMVVGRRGPRYRHQHPPPPPPKPMDEAARTTSRRGQAVASADEILQRGRESSPPASTSWSVYEMAASAGRSSGKLDFLAFFHEPHYAWSRSSLEQDATNRACAARARSTRPPRRTSNDPRPRRRAGSRPRPSRSASR